MSILSERNRRWERVERGQRFLDEQFATRQANMTAMQRRRHKSLPAFGAELLDLRRRGLVPKRHAFFGDVLICLDSWKIGRAIRLYRMVIDTDHHIESLDFSMVAGLETILAYSPALSTCERRDAAIRQILRADPVSFRVIDLNAPSLGFWIKSRKLGVEMPEYL